MPLTAVAITDFDTDLMRETTQDNELKVRLTNLYEQDKRLHEFESGQLAMAYFEQAFAKGQQMYVGMFNDKPICAVGSQLDSSYKTLKLTNLAMHTQNLNRGIELQFIRLIKQDIEKNSDNELALSSQIAEIAHWIAQATTIHN